MIQSIELINFQSHKNSVLEFSPGVNVIIGQSDAGKTAIIRALRWVVQNRPGGDSIKSYWGGITSVGVGLPEGVVEKTRNKATTYYLNDTEFKAMGTDVPEEIQRIMNFSEVNLQQQLDRPFLLDLSAGEVAGHFNQIAHLDIIDKGISNVQRWVREIEGDIKSADQQLKDAELSLKELEYLPEMEMMISTAERSEAESMAKKKQIHALKDWVKQIADTKIQISKYTAMLPLEKPVNMALEVMTSKKVVQEKQNKLQRLVTDFTETITSLQKARRPLQAETAVDEALQLCSKRKEMQIQRKDLQYLIQNITNFDKLITTTFQEIDSLVSQMPDICPFCGNPIK